jgi:hypothetical protein
MRTGEAKASQLDKTLISNATSPNASPANARVLLRRSPTNVAVAQPHGSVLYESAAAGSNALLGGTCFFTWSR